METKGNEELSKVNCEKLIELSKGLNNKRNKKKAVLEIMRLSENAITHYAKKIVNVYGYSEYAVIYEGSKEQYEKDLKTIGFLAILEDMKSDSFIPKMERKIKHKEMTTAVAIRSYFALTAKHEMIKKVVSDAEHYFPGTTDYYNEKFIQFKKAGAQLDMEAKEILSLYNKYMAENSTAKRKSVSEKTIHTIQYIYRSPIGPIDPDDKDDDESHNPEKSALKIDFEGTGKLHVDVDFSNLYKDLSKNYTNDACRVLIAYLKAISKLSKNGQRLCIKDIAKESKVTKDDVYTCLAQFNKDIAEYYGYNSESVLTYNNHKKSDIKILKTKSVNCSIEKEKKSKKVIKISSPKSQLNIVSKTTLDDITPMPFIDEKIINFARESASYIPYLQMQNVKQMQMQ